jgi:hypothetical protein
VGSDLVEDFNFLIFPSSTRVVLDGLETLSEDLGSMIHSGSRQGRGNLRCCKLASEVYNERVQRKGGTMKSTASPVVDQERVVGCELGRRWWAVEGNDSSSMHGVRVRS